MNILCLLGFHKRKHTLIDYDFHYGNECVRCGQLLKDKNPVLHHYLERKTTIAFLSK